MVSILRNFFYTGLITALILLNPVQLRAQEAKSTGAFDETLTDMTIVLGAGAAGAILGLSTLSFADKPKDHYKNIAIGGALGIILGVGIVIFGQASKSQALVAELDYKKTPRESEVFFREEFFQKKIAEKYLAQTHFQYNFTF